LFKILKNLQGHARERIFELQEEIQDLDNQERELVKLAMNNTMLFYITTSNSKVDSKFTRCTGRVELT